jgi:hypothetical protein
MSIISRAAVSTASSSAQSNGDFSIEGLDHGLLSRGTGNSSRKKNLDGTKIKKQRKQKSLREKRGEGRSEGKDVWGLRNELSTCDDLIRLGNVAAVALEVINLCNALLLIDNGSGRSRWGSSYGSIACQLQNVMDKYVSQVESNPCNAAPSYPFEWLSKRNMTNIRYFQLPEDAKDSNIILFTNLVDNGISLWKNLKKISLNITPAL